MGMALGRILIIEDTLELARLISKTLEEEGFETKVAENAQSAFRLLVDHWDLLILDLMLPDASGEEILRYVAQQDYHPSVLVVTARNRLEDKLALFRAGCDDYLTKPFDIQELIERAQALLRRTPRTAQPPLQYEDMALDSATFQLSVGNQRVTLTPKEAAICKALMHEPERVVSKKELLHSVWGMTYDPQTNFIGVHLVNLRKKLASLGRSEWLNTVRGSGVSLLRPRATA